jgi:hypothetical protein
MFRTSVARISYYAALAMTRMRLSLKESRMKLLNATSLDRKSGIRGPKTMGEAPHSLSVFCALGVLDDWLEQGAVFEEIYQAGSHMIDVVAHCSLCGFTVVCFEGLQNRQVGI